MGPVRWSLYGANEVVMVWGQWGGHGMGPMRWSWYGASEVVMVWGQWGGHGMGPMRWSLYGAKEVVMVWGQWGGHGMGPLRWSWYEEKILKKKMQKMERWIRLQAKNTSKRLLLYFLVVRHASNTQSTTQKHTYLGNKIATSPRETKLTPGQSFPVLTWPRQAQQTSHNSTNLKSLVWPDLGKQDLFPRPPAFKADASPPGHQGEYISKRITKPQITLSWTTYTFSHFLYSMITTKD